MSAPNDEAESVGLSFVHGGPSYRLAERLGLARPDGRRRLVKISLLLLLTWVPVAVLSAISGHVTGDAVKKPFFHDPEVQARFLFVVPLLEIGAMMVAVSLSVQTRHLLEVGIVPEREQARFRAAQGQAVKLRDSLFGEATIVILAFAISLVSRLALGFNAGDSSWEFAASKTTPAGWWYMIVSLPVLYFFLVRWVWVFLVWAWFLFRISRLELDLTATHPDRTGGLGFIGWGLASFATVLMAVSAVMSAAFADEILNRGASFDDLKYHVVVFIVTSLVILHLPLLAFAAKLSRCRFSGLLEFGALAWRHDRAFDEKWIEGRADEKGEVLLGSADVQSLADIATCYEHVERMWPIPFDVKAFAILVLSALLPMIPLVGTKIPLDEIFMKLGELLV